MKIRIKKKLELTTIEFIILWVTFCVSFLFMLWYILIKNYQGIAMGVIATITLISIIVYSIKKNGKEYYQIIECESYEVIDGVEVR